MAIATLTTQVVVTRHFLDYTLRSAAAAPDAPAGLVDALRRAGATTAASPRRPLRLTEPQRAYLAANLGRWVAAWGWGHATTSPALRGATKVAWRLLRAWRNEAAAA
jgi:hypothetical protein